MRIRNSDLSGASGPKSTNSGIDILSHLSSSHLFKLLEAVEELMPVINSRDSFQVIHDYDFEGLLALSRLLFGHF